MPGYRWANQNLCRRLNATASQNDKKNVANSAHKIQLGGELSFQDKAEV